MNMTVSLVNLDHRLAVFADGAVAQIATMVDVDGDETDDTFLCEVFVCHHPCGKWVTCPFREVAPPIRH